MFEYSAGNDRMEEEDVNRQKQGREKAREEVVVIVRQSADCQISIRIEKLDGN